MRNPCGERWVPPPEASAGWFGSGEPVRWAGCCYELGAFAPGGTASEVSIPGYKLAGKTGTANKIDPTTHEYSESSYVASFIGFAPALHPKLLIEVMVDEPQTEIYGGVVAAPAFEKIASFALPYLRIPPG